jgi:hypothetical protein
MAKKTKQPFGQASAEAAFPNGVKVDEVLCFIRERAYQVGLEETGERFGLTALEVAEAVSLDANDFERVEPLA